MSNLLIFLIELNLTILILFSIYLIIKNVLENKVRRILVLSIPALAFLALAFQNTLFSNVSIANVPIFELNLFGVTNNVSTASSFDFSLNMWYWLGVVLFSIWFLIKVGKILYFFKSANTVVPEGYKILITDNKDSFSFFNFIHLSANLDEVEKQIVLEHELIHVRKKHALDLMIMAVYHSLLWFNPLFYIMKKELVHVHEFEVDEKMYGKYHNAYIKHLVSYSLGSNSSRYLLTSQFYNELSLTKRTKKMKTKSKNRNVLFISIPLVACLFVFVSWTNLNSEVLIEKPNTTKHLENDIEVQPEFVGGQKALMNYLVKSIKYPEKAKKNNIEGTVHVKFKVSKSGQIENVTLKKSVNTLLDIEAVRVIKSMPNWNPGQKDGKAVAVEMVMPIKFQLTGS